MKQTLRVLLAVVVLGVVMPATTPTQEVGEKLLLDNKVVTIIQYTFPPGFRGEEHAAIANEFAYVLEGEFTVVTQGRGKRIVKKGEVEYADKGTVHFSLNESKAPAVVVVVVLKEP